MSYKRTDLIVKRIRAYFDRETTGLSSADYKQVVEEVASTMESLEDCIRDEEEEAS